MGALLEDRLVFTQEEYFLLDESRGNLEYWAGQLVVLENNTASHGTVIANLIAGLRPLIKRPCRSMTNVGVRAGHKTHFLKPDLMVICGPNKFYQKREDIVTNPKVIFEVLSRSTASYDKREKLELYRTIRTLEEYILISQTQAQVLRYRRHSGAFWGPDSIEGLSSSLQISALDCSLPMSEIYRDIEFPSA